MRIHSAVAFVVLSSACGPQEAVVVIADDDELSPAEMQLGASGSYVIDRFDSDPSWEGNANVPDPSLTPCRQATFDFGYSADTQHAGTTAGEIGGTFTRSTAQRAYYAMPLGRTMTLADRFTASGRIAVLSRMGGDVAFGWFNHDTSTEWRASDALVLHVGSDQGSGGDSYGLFAMLGSRNYLSNGTKASLVALDFGVQYAWTLDYDPQTRELAVVVNGERSSVVVTDEVIADGAAFDRFGFLGIQGAGGGQVTAFIDDVVVDGVAVGFEPNRDPHWQGVGNRATATDCYVPRRQDFGYRPSALAGGEAGELGGGLWPQPPAWYAAQTGPLNLNDTMYVTGKIRLTHASVDSNLWLGWFNSQQTVQPFERPKTTKDSVAFDLVAAHIGGPTHWGYRFVPYFLNGVDPGTGRGEKRDPGAFNTDMPLLNAHGSYRTFWICYVPNADGQGNGRLTTGLNAAPKLGLPRATSTTTIPAAYIEHRGTFDRFGVISASTGGKVVEIFLDDLRFTTGAGDVGAPRHCE